MGESEKKGVTVNVAEDVTSLQSDEQKKEKVSDRKPASNVPRVVINVKLQKMIKWWLKPSIIFA